MPTTSTTTTTTTFTSTTLYPDINNPSKEILASRSGLWDNIIYAATGYFPDLPNDTVPNTGINVTTTPTSTTVSATGSAIAYLGLLSSGNQYIDDMLVFNPYIHYYNQNKFHPQKFLQQSITFFNFYG